MLPVWSMLILMLLFYCLLLSYPFLFYDLSCFFYLLVICKRPLRLWRCLLLLQLLVYHLSCSSQWFVFCTRSLCICGAVHRCCCFQQCVIIWIQITRFSFIQLRFIYIAGLQVICVLNWFGYFDSIQYFVVKSFVIC